jgi:hypothetical protein
MQQLMDEFGITSVYQPNAELPEHHLIAPLLSYLKWQAWKDWLDWLAWLRSDYILLRPQALKLAVDTIWKAGQQKPPIAPDFKDQPLLHKFSKAELPMDSGVYAICQQLVDCYLDRGSLSERDQLNLDAFLSLTASFELDPSQPRKDLPAYLEYLEDLRGQDALKQVAIEGGTRCNCSPSTNPRVSSLTASLCFTTLAAGTATKAKSWTGMPFLPARTSTASAILPSAIIMANSWNIPTTRTCIPARNNAPCWKR